MAKSDNSKTILTIVAVVVGFLLIAGIIGGVGFYIYNKSRTVSPSPSLTQTATTGDLVSYQNLRYGFSLKYPQSFSKQESQNGDGVTLTMNDPAITIRVYASMNALSQNLNEYLNWTRDNLSQDSTDQEDIKEILAEAIPLGTAEIPAQERQWTFTKADNGTLVLVDHVTFLKDDIFYNIQMELDYSDYDEYAAHVFDGILANYQMK